MVLAAIHHSIASGDCRCGRYMQVYAGRILHAYHLPQMCRQAVSSRQGLSPSFEASISHLPKGVIRPCALR